MSLTIRPFQPSDLERLQEITVEGFEPVSIDRNIERQFGTVLGRDWRWRKCRALEADIARNRAGVFVAVVDGAVAGYITTWIDREAGIGHIPNLAVDRRRRGQGLGRRLIEHALDHFRRAGAALAKIETLEQNPVGQSLYPACGFQEVARQIHYCLRLEDESLESESPGS